MSFFFRIHVGCVSRSEKNLWRCRVVRVSVDLHSASISRNQTPIFSVLRVNAVNCVRRRNTNKINIIADKHADRTDTQYERKKEVLNRNSVNWVQLGPTDKLISRQQQQQIVIIVRFLCGCAACCVGLTENAGHEIAGHENTGYEFARHGKHRMKIDYITLECAFLLNFKSFVCKTSVLTYKKFKCACSS